MKKRFFLVITSCLLLALLSGCDRDIQNVRFDFVQPPRIIYIANVDTELDFSGATLVARGLRGTSPGDEFSLLLDLVTVEHSIDFTKPGVYAVELIYYVGTGRFPIPFFVQVIDEEVFRQLKEMAE